MRTHSHRDSSRPTCRAAALALGAVLLLGAGPSRADVQPHGGMLRFPAVSAEKIAFVYASDIWIVGREGGLAQPLASPPGLETRPRFSPKGDAIAFQGNYEGNSDLYVIDVAGGTARRVTHHPATELLQQWTRDGRLLYASGAEGAPRSNHQLYTVKPEGGLPEKLPVAFGAMSALSDDGRWLAFTPHTRDHRTWKRYRGGMATDIWLFDLRSGDARQITDWEGTDTAPMWAKDILYYLSDQGPEHRWNIWKFDPQTNAREQVTRFADFDVKEPSIGPGPQGTGEIVFQKGSGIHLLDVASGRVRAIEVRIPGDRPHLRADRVDVSGFIQAWGVSSTGKRAVVEMRGDIWSVPTDKGVAVNFTRSSGIAERNPVWSPDGRWIAYFSDADGEYEIYVRQSDGKDEPRRVGKFGAPYKEGMGWSPKSDKIAYVDKSGAFYLVDVENGRRTLVHHDQWGDNPDASFSHDGAWIAFTTGADNTNSTIWLYEVASGKKHQVTSGMFHDRMPAFDRKGEFLYYVSARVFEDPSYEDVGSTFIYDDTEVVLMVPLRKDVEVPGRPTEDHEAWGDEKEKDEEEADKSEDEKKKDAKEEKDKDKDAPPLVIELEGLEARALQLELKKGSFGRLEVADGGSLVYTRGGFGPGGAIHLYDPAADEPEEKTILSGFGTFRLTADGKKLLVRRDKEFAVIEPKADQKFEDTFSVAGLETMIDPRAEWTQIFEDSWRFYRDYFYDAGMHGVDWKGIREQYRTMLADCSSRHDLEYVIKEMISEVNVGHAYHGGGDMEEVPNRNVGLLGVDFEVERGAYRIAKIYEGAPWDSDARSPLRTGSGEVKEGDYLLAVNGVPVDPALDPWAAFVGTAGKTTRLTVSESPKADDKARDVLVEPMGNDSSLRYRHWIEQNRLYVAEKTDGQVGYIYVPNTGVDGQNNLFRQFYGQRDKAALIIDERWNGGGQIPTRFIELLNRPRTNYWAVRDGERGYFAWPYDSHQGPKCMLINGLAGSGGDALPAYFRQAGLGKLIGERTWGGLVGISGSRPIIDGAFLAVPNFAYYDTDGTWGIEGHGVDPDLHVVADPAQLAKGVDPQLEAAIAQMLEEIRTNPYRTPPPPKGPDRKGMGIAPEDM